MGDFIAFLNLWQNRGNSRMLKVQTKYWRGLSELVSIPGDSTQKKLLIGGFSILFTCYHLKNIDFLWFF